jgi:threonylcarbamoyladenosine tRNA methylthiotransferase MtaB
MIPYKKVAFYTLGCKLNFSETSTIARLFENNGIAQVDFFEKPDIYVINTCSVTDYADKKCRNLVRKALNHNPDAFIAVIGCYAQLKPDEIAKIEGVDIVLGAAEKFNILEHIEKNEAINKQTATVYSSAIKDVKEFVPAYSFGDRTRSFLKVQDGCDYFCSFCTIPLARGTSRSASIENTVKKAKEVAAKGIKEIVLTGVNIGDFGKNSGETFLELIQKLDNITGVERFRISSIEPNLLSDEIIRFVAGSQKFVPHFHIPLQSGSDKILKLMRRRYDTELYKNRITYIKSLMPDCCIGVDVIVGFPGETENDFNDTCNFITGLDASYLHVFTYSERENTTATRMTDVVPQNERNRRNKVLQIISEKMKRKFYSAHIGQVRPVLFENGEAEAEDFIYGFTDNYIKVKTKRNNELINNITPVLLSGLDGNGEMIAHIVKKDIASHTEKYS